MSHVLIVDNYDSFTFNIRHYVVALGHHVTLLENDNPALDDISSLQCDRIILSPGPGNPNDAGKTLEVIDRYHRNHPILGICMGHQCIAAYFGATVTHARAVMHGKLSTFHHNHHALFAELPDAFDVMRYHSLIVDHTTLPDTLHMTGWTQGHHGEIDEMMAFAHRELPIYGIQYHPEAVLTEYGYDVLARFLS